MRIGYITAATCFWDGQTLSLQSGAGRVIEELLRRHPHTIICASTLGEKKSVYDCHIPLRDGQFIALPTMPSIASGMKQGAACRRVIRQLEDRSDVLLIQLPFSAPTGLFAQRTPRVYHVCADIRGVVGASQYYSGVRGLAAKTAAEVIDGVQKILFHRPETRLMTNGAEMFEHYGAPLGRPVLSSILRKSEVASFPRKDFHDGRDGFKILFVGFLRPEKGLDTLVESYRALLGSAADRLPELHIVGAVDAVEGGAAEDLQRSLDELKDKGRVVFHGMKRFGPELFKMFANADVLVVPSRSEGTPRVLVEARAFGCPVIGTRVGGIPTSIEHGVDGLLVDVDAPEQLAESIRRLVEDKKLYRQLQTEGLKRAQHRTLEHYVDEMLTECTLALQMR